MRIMAGKTRTLLIILALSVAFVALFSGTLRADNPDQYYRGYDNGFSAGVAAAKANQTQPAQCSGGQHYCDGYLRGYADGYASILTPPMRAAP